VTKIEAAAWRQINHECDQCHLSPERNYYERYAWNNGLMIKAYCGSCGLYLGNVPVIAFYLQLADRESQPGNPEQWKKPKKPALKKFAIVTQSFFD